MFHLVVQHSSYLPVPESLRSTDADYCIKANVFVNCEFPFVPVAGMLIDASGGPWKISEVRYSHRIKLKSKFHVNTDPSLFTPREERYKNARNLEELEEMLKSWSTFMWDQEFKPEVSIKRVPKDYIPENFREEIGKFLSGSSSGMEDMLNKLMQIKFG